MAVEIERKFLVHRDRLPALPAGETICQGYIPALDRITVRVRIRAARAWLTLKGPTTGISRSEFEYEIPVEDAKAILTQLCQPGAIEKTRHEIEHDGMRWELDVFAEANAGLMIAELELQDESQPFTLPDWVAEEVSADPRYSNQALLQNPWKRWAGTCHENATQN